MKTTKLVFFYIFLIITIINTMLMYAEAPISNYDTTSKLLLTLVVLVLSGLFTLIAAISKRRFTKKLLLRAQLLMVIILVVASIVARIQEVLWGSVDVMFAWRCGATLLYFIIFLLTVGLSRDVFKQLLQIFYSNKN